MRKFMVRVLAGSAVLAAALLPQAHAEVLGFESVDIGVRPAGASFTELGYTWTVVGDFGDVDTASGFSAELGVQAPTGNASQFYSGLNDSRVTLTRTDGAAFRVSGFEAAFVAPTPQAAGVLPGQIVVHAVASDGVSVDQNWQFAPSGATGTFAFSSYAGAEDFENLLSIKSITFSACVFSTTGSSCRNPAVNLAQFSLDNVTVSAVPEPASLVLMALGLGGLALRARSSVR